MGPDTPSAPTWVVGAGGLLGGAVVAELGRRGERVLTVPVVPWADSDAALRQLRAGVRSLAERSGPRPRVAWCAGAGVTGTPADVLDAEVGVLRRFLEELGRLPPRTLGGFFFASSAGGVYAGSVEPPFTENHPVVPLSPYGYAKVAAEAAVTRFARETGVPTVIGRIANLYGAGQDLGKAQGLVSHICRSYLTAQPVSVYVSLDTLRDYLYVSDGAARSWTCSTSVPTGQVTKTVRRP